MKFLNLLFGKTVKDAAPLKDKRLPDTAVSSPPYYEAWGGLERANRALWAGFWLSSTALLLCLILLQKVVSRPPGVIRVDASGAVAFVGGKELTSPVTGAEIKNFLALFERFFFALNVYTYEDDLNRAFSMMTPSFQAKANELLKTSGTIENLKSKRQRIRVFLGQLDITGETEEIVECRIKGTKEIGSFDAEKPTLEVVFEHEIILRKVPRSEKAPYGVLVEDLRESVYKS